MSMSTGRRGHVAGLLAALGLLCSTAQAKDLPYEAATITGSVVGNHKIFKGLDERVIITSVDHIPIALQLVFASANTKQTLKPGRHFIHAQYTSRGWTSNGRLWVDAEAGKAYSVHARSENSRVTFWIE